ncbi:F0F1 ATP synthase subunit alpha [Bacillus cereus]|nr:F0F1 ATP synthase subunit alpha [Bacillus cereus]
MNVKKVVLASALGFAALVGTNLPGLEATKASAAVETNTVTIEGPVIEVGEHDFYIKSPEYNEDFDNLVRVEVDSNANVKVGDYVKATGYMWRNFSTYMTATKVEKVNAVKMLQNHETLHEGEYNPVIEAYEYEIGHVVDVFTDTESGVTSVLFEYTGRDGEKLEIEVRLQKEQEFHVGDKVKVHMVNAWRGVSLGGFVIFGGIEKVNY